MVMILSVGGALPDELEDFRFDLFEGLAGGIDKGGVGRLDERRSVAAAVAGVAVGDLAREFVEVDGETFGFEFGGTAAGTFLGAGIEKDLDVGVGENDTANVAAFHDEARFLGHVALDGHHGAAHTGDGGHKTGGGGDFGRADGVANVFAVQEYAARLHFEFNVGVFGHGFHAFHVRGINARAQHPKGDGAVHGAGVDIDGANLFGDAARDGALARTRGAVDCDDDSPSHHFHHYRRSGYNKAMRRIFVSLALAGILLAANPVTDAKALIKAKKFEEAVTLLEPALKAKPADAATKATMVEALMGSADSYMYNESLPPFKKYPTALRMYRRVVEIDKGHQKAKDNVAMIENIYKSMGRPVPQ